jgi:50S ribosomal subunit-associated GTPase HflX
VGGIRKVVVVGLLSAKVKDYESQVDDLCDRLAALGAEVCGRFIQRRGVSDGGVKLLGAPLSRRFVIGPGKLAEVEAACELHEVDAVVFVNELDEYQRGSLAGRLGVPVFGSGDMGESQSR